VAGSICVQEGAFRLDMPPPAEAQSLPKGRMAPQSGQVHTMPLQVMPQKFSSMHSEQIMNPQGQFQQKG